MCNAFYLCTGEKLQSLVADSSGMTLSATMSLSERIPALTRVVRIRNRVCVQNSRLDLLTLTAFDNLLQNISGCYLPAPPPVDPTPPPPPVCEGPNGEDMYQCEEAAKRGVCLNECYALYVVSSEF